MKLAMAFALALLWASTASAQWEVICQSKGKIDGIHVHVVMDSSGNVAVDSSRNVAVDSCGLAMKAQPVFRINKAQPVFRINTDEFNELTDDEFNELLNKASKLEIDGLPKFDVNMEGSE